MKKIILVFILLKTFSISAFSQGHQLDSDSTSGSALYPWPDRAPSPHYADRYSFISDEMKKYSSVVKDLNDKLSFSPERVQRVGEIHKSKNTGGFCSKVKKLLVKKTYSDGLQYGLCGEGAYVAACLAIEQGYTKEEILLCKGMSANGKLEHQWTLVPESPGANSYCIFDRFNSSRCGITFVDGKKNPTNGGYSAKNISFAGRRASNTTFEGADCPNLINYILIQNYYNK